MSMNKDKKISKVYVLSFAHVHVSNKFIKLLLFSKKDINRKRKFSGTFSTSKHYHLNICN